jgi:hypothetical protein
MESIERNGVPTIEILVRLAQMVIADDARATLTTDPDQEPKIVPKRSRKAKNP